MTIAWVVGGGGVLGSALRRSLLLDGTELFSPAERFHWDSGELEMARQIAAAVQAFAYRASSARRWEIYWAAGIGTMSSRESELAVETHVLSLLLQCVAAESGLVAMPGAIAFASSAGAIYGGSSTYVITEETAAAPTTAYARTKLRQEHMLRSFALANDRTTALLARFSTLYGPGQSLGKKQGLLAHIARSILRNQPIQIYVQLDTVRDYIAADDAAAVMVAALRAKSEKCRVLTKIIASERPATIAEIISIFKRIARRRPRIVISASKISDLYAHRALFRSEALRESMPRLRVTLPIGISLLMAAERVALARNLEVWEV